MDRPGHPERARFTQHSPGRDLVCVGRRMHRGRLLQRQPRGRRDTGRVVERRRLEDPTHTGPRGRGGQPPPRGVLRAAACTAVGEYMDSVGVLWAFAEQWTGSGWHVQRVPTPGHATGSQLSAVWCTSSSVCTAVGYYNTRDGVQTTLAEVWNGTSWEIEHPAVPDGAVASQLAGVVCTSGNGCTAVGSYVNQVGATFTLAERRVGTTWDLQPTSNAPGALATVLTALSCTSSQVCAVDRVQVLPLLVRTPPPASRDRRDVERTPMGYGDGRQPVRHRQQRPGRSVLCRHAVHRRRFPVRLGRA